MKNRTAAYFYFLSVPWIAALSCFGGLAVGKLQHTGAMWILSWIVGVLLIVANFGGRKITFPWLYWAPFYLYSFCSLSWGEFIVLGDIQLGIQMSVYLVVGIVASFAIRSVDDLKPLNWMYVATALIIGAVCVYFEFGPGRALQDWDKDRYIGFAERPAGCSLTIIAAVFLAQCKRRPLAAVLMWLFCLILSILSGGRMATLVVMMLCIVNPLFATLGKRIAMVMFMALVALVAFNLPIIQDRFFNTSTGFAGKGKLEDVAEGNFDSSGRFDAWPLIFREANRYPVMGHGMGKSSPYVYKVWPPMDKPHNEYLKIYFEGGIIGLFLFLFAIFGTWWNLVQVSRNSDRIANWAWAAAYMGLFSFVVNAVVDNPLVYGNNFMHPLFALIGAANGIAYGERMQQQDLEDESDQSNQAGPDLYSRGFATDDWQEFSR